jgi:signal transduction histidine kinase
VTAALLQKLTLEEMLEIVCHEARQLTGAEGGALFSLEDETWLEIVHSVGALKPVIARMPLEGTFTGQAIRNGEPLLLNDPKELAQASHLVPNLESLLVIPMRLEGSIGGALDVVNKPSGFTPDDVRILSLFADGAALAIERAWLHQQAEQLAVMEERQRLARQLHDSVTQALYSVTLYAEAARMAMSSGKHEVAIDNLQELHSMAREAMLDMRMLIFELHPPVLKEEGLVAALQARLAAVEARAGLQTEIQVAGERRLPLSVEEELFWIAVEAFNNVVKHARAQKVTVRVQFDERDVCLEIRDDGRGFDLVEARHGGGMGLRGIEERVQRINGQLEIRSTPVEGTTLKVRVEI